MDDFTNDYGVSPTPFDDVFKTECEKLRAFLVPLIKEVFGLDCTIEEGSSVQGEPNERYLINSTKPVSVSKRFTDSCLRIGNKLYHVECESQDDGSILLRLAEYNVRIAIDNAVNDYGNDRVLIRLPESALLRLRSSEADSKIIYKTIEYAYENQVITIKTPVMNVQAYSAEEIFEKKLYFLIPFYCVRYEKIFKHFSETDPAEYDRIYLELKNYYDNIMTICAGGEITEDEARKLAELSRIILSHITAGLDKDERERMVNTVGGQVLELQEDRWLKQGIEQGIGQGIDIGKITARFEDGMSIEMIASKMHISEDDVIAVLKDAHIIQD